MSGDSNGRNSEAHKPPVALRAAELARLLVAVAVVQAVFWLFVNPVLFARGHGNHTSYELSSFQAAKLETPDAAGLAKALFEPIEGPGWYACCEPGYWAVRFQVDIPAPPERGIGVLPQIAADNFQVLVNGVFVIGRGRMELGHNTYHGNDKRIEFIPSSALRPGKNQVDYIAVRDAMPYFDLGRPVFGPFDEITSAYGLQAFMLGPFEFICVVAGFVLTGFALVLLIQSEAKGFAFALVLLTLSWTLKAHHYAWSEPPFGGATRLFYYFMVTGLVPIAWLNFADQWTGRPIRWVSLGCIAATAVMAVVFAYALWGMPAGEGFDFASSALNAMAAILMGVTFVRFAWHVQRHGDQRTWEVAIFVLILVLAAIEFAYEFFVQEATAYLTRTTPFLILALAIAVFARSIRLFRSADQINQVLSERLALRERDLTVAHARERSFVRRQAHSDERQRILRDMHDGLGSQLMSMLLAARRGEAKPDRVAEGLQSVIDEMRLIIASMDSVGESLFAALALFKDRMTPRIESAGFKLEWTNRYGADFPAYGPRPTLQVFRILQEAVTNALKHSGGTTIRIVIEPGPGNPANVRISISDDGVAVTGATPGLVGTGRGLANMRTRAQGIGAVLEIASDGKGVCVMLDLPASGDATQDEDPEAPVDVEGRATP